MDCDGDTERRLSERLLGWSDHVGFEVVEPGRFRLLEPTTFGEIGAGAIIRGQVDDDGLLRIDEVVEPAPLPVKTYMLAKGQSEGLRPALDHLRDRGGEWALVFGGMLHIQADEDTLVEFEAALREAR